MNNANILGRITNDLELKTTANGHTVLRFSVAIRRKYCRPGEERKTDFISCIAWNSRADFISKYFGKGKMIAISGELHSDTFLDKQGIKRYITELVVTDASFTGEKSNHEQLSDALNENIVINEFDYIPDSSIPEYPMGDETL